MTQLQAKSEVASAYDQWAETYDTAPNCTRELAASVLSRANLRLAGRRVVEIGCGTGRNTEWVAQHAGKVVGLDFSEGMLRQARARISNPTVRFVQHDIRTTWPVPDASADLVIAMLVLEHVDDLMPTIAEAARTLVAGGELFICELHPMRQLLGGQAQFTNTQTAERQLVPAFLHDVSDYVNAGLAKGFELVNLREWRDLEEPRMSAPRLLSLLFRSRALPE